MYLGCITAMLYSCTGFFNCGSFPLENPDSCKQVEDTNLVTPTPEPAPAPPAGDMPPNTPDEPPGPSETDDEPIKPIPEPPISDEPDEPPAEIPETLEPEKELPETNLPVVTPPIEEPPVTGIDLCTWYEENPRNSGRTEGKTCGCYTDWEGNRFNQYVITMVVNGECQYLYVLPLMIQE